MNDPNAPGANMISLGLNRIAGLLSRLGHPQYNWAAVHVAGTNGKGSVCAYISSVLQASQIRTGRFTSPYLIDRWDCIEIVGKPVDEQTFLKVEKQVKRISELEKINATPFEILTATAFEIFRLEKIKIGIIEVGLGGLTDSTNSLPDNSILCSAITRISLDHQGFLGHTLEDITIHKGGIIRPHVPCVTDSSNPPTVLRILKTMAEKKNADLILAKPETHISSPLFGDYQKSNLGIALEVLKIIGRSEPSITQTTIEHGIANTKWPGRLQQITVESRKLLLDGAHNVEAACCLREYVDTEIRPYSPRITWVVGFSKPDDEFAPILNSFGITDSDSVYCAEFSPVADMPWVRATDSKKTAQEAEKITKYSYPFSAIPQNFDFSRFKHLLKLTDNNVVVCGSLYLVAEILRGLRD